MTVAREDYEAKIIFTWKWLAMFGSAERAMSDDGKWDNRVWKRRRLPLLRQKSIAVPQLLKQSRRQGSRACLYLWRDQISFSELIEKNVVAINNEFTLAAR